MENPIQKIIALIKKTGDNCIILDSKGEPSYVAMSFQAYEKLIQECGNVSNLSEDQLIDRINQDVADWRAGQVEESKNWQIIEDAIKEVKNPSSVLKGDDSSFTKEIKNNDNSLNEANNEKNEDRYYFEPIE